jgi:hypothetical protein
VIYADDSAGDRLAAIATPIYTGWERLWFCQECGGERWVREEKSPNPPGCCEWEMIATPGMRRVPA